MKDNCSATLTLVGHICGSWEKADSPLMGAVPDQAKAFLPRIPLVSTTKQHPLKGFFASKVAASDATDKAPTWASFTEYIGLSLPLIACRANLVKVSRNLCRLSGKMSAMRIELTRPSALGLCIHSKDGEGSNAYLIAP